MNESNQNTYSMDDYLSALDSFDKAVCEACAVSNLTGDRYVIHYKGYSTGIFTRICIHSQALISSLPKSRWAKREYECWDFSVIASHVRALMEGFLLFEYLSEKPKSEQEWHVKVNIMHLNDCTRRVRFHKNIDNNKDEELFRNELKVIKQKLTDSDYFQNLPKKTQKRLLSGRAMMIPSRDDLLKKLGEDVGLFNAFYDLVSNYTHILPISFYRSEPNGRGTGVINKTDFNYIILSIENCTDWLETSTSRMVEMFPDSGKARKGKESKFTIGPDYNTKNWP